MSTRKSTLSWALGKTMNTESLQVPHYLFVYLYTVNIEKSQQPNNIW